MSEPSLKKQTVSGLFWKMAERIGSQIIRMVVMIVLARILMPEDYGAIALVMVFISICDVILINGLSSPLIQKKDADSLDFSTIFYCSIALGLVLFLIVYLSAPAIARFYDMEVLCPVLRVLSIGVVVSSIGSVQNAYVSRIMQFKTFFFASLIGLVVSGVIGIWMAYQGYGYGNNPKQQALIRRLYKEVAGDFKPDLTFLLDIPVAEGLKRSRRSDNKEQRFEDKEVQFHEHLREAYLEMAKAEPKRFVVLDARQPIMELHQQIMQNLMNRLFFRNNKLNKTCLNDNKNR